MDLQKFFNPSSIAVVGVSHEKHKVGYLAAENLIDQGYKGEIYFVNNKFKGEILGKKVYSSLKEIDKPIGLVVLAVPAAIAVYLFDEVHDLGIKNIVLYAAGFKETGKEGQVLEKLLDEKIKKYNLNILGPNCIGYVNTTKGVNVTFLKDVCPAGNIGFISQSGALGSMLNDYFNAHENLGFSYFISLGNKTVIDEADALEFLVRDEKTKVIAVYLEDVKDGEKFKRVSAEVSGRKPIVVLKAGSTKEGSKAAVSHTGGMVGDDQVYGTVFKQYGVIRAAQLGEFLTLLKVFSFQREPVNRSVLVLSNAGGAGVMLTDGLIRERLPLVTVSPEVKEMIVKSMKGKKITLHNPIDLLGDASAFDYEKVIGAMLEEKNIGAIIVLLTPQANTEIAKTAEIIVEMQKKFALPVYPIFMGKKSMAGVGRLFEKNKIAGFANFDHLPKALAKINWWRENFREGGRMDNILLKLDSFDADRPENKRARHDGPLRHYNLSNSMETLASIGIPTIPLYLAKSVDDLRTIVKKTGFPVVAKIASDKITHKTDVGGVVTGIKTMDEMEIIFKKIVGARRASPVHQGMYIQSQINGFEMLVGAKRDPVFGIVLVIGLGGIYTELLKDIAYRIYPFGFEEFRKMIKETKQYKLIGGFRGSGPIDEKRLYHITAKLGQLMENNPQIREVDINPLMVSDKIISAVDCRIITENHIPNK